MKTVLLIPGFHEDFATKDYASLVTAIKAKGYSVVFIPIRWDRTTLTNWVEQLNTVYAAHDPSETILAGFSYGAMTAFVAAAQQNPAELWLFSLSPYFADDLPALKKTWLRKIGHRRVTSFQALHFSQLAAKITCKTLIFVGQTEAETHPQLNVRAHAAQKQIIKSTLTTIPETAHDVTDTRYIRAIEKTI